jgi:hypothetical protein
MKTILATVTCSVILLALAACAQPDAVAQSGKTRAEVRAELVQAEREGWISTLKQRAYPPVSGQTGQIRSNGEVYQANAGSSKYYEASNQRP